MDSSMPAGYLNQKLPSGQGQEPLATNPPFRTPVGMWNSGVKLERDIIDILKGELGKSLNNRELQEKRRDLEDTRNTPVPTSLPKPDVFSRLLGKVDGLVILHITPGAGYGRKRLAKPSSSLEDYFCGPDAGMAEKLYDEYINLATLFSTNTWQSQANVQDLHGAARNTLRKLQRENQRIGSRDKSNFVNYFKEQVDSIEKVDVADTHVMLSDDFDADAKRRTLLKDAKIIFAHVAALVQAYENDTDPICASKELKGTYVPSTGVLRGTMMMTTRVRHPRFANQRLPDQDRSSFLRSTNSQQEGPNSVVRSFTKSVLFSESTTDIPAADDDSEPTSSPSNSPHQSDDSNMDTTDDALNGSPSSSGQKNSQPGFSPSHQENQTSSSLEQTDTETGSDNDDSELESSGQDSGSLFDTRSSDTRGRVPIATKEWLSSHLNRTMPLLKGRRMKDDERVRIAVLDTGIDLTHPKFAKSKARIIESISWVADDPSTDDLCGHGTHIASILLKMAPWAHVYVAKVFKDEEDVTESGVSAIVKAINHARTKWKVDILSLSFGYRKYKPEIEAAIKACGEAKPPVLVFAAAANTGALDRPTFPARMTGVFCINSASGHGAWSPYNPRSGDGNDKFTVFGEDIAGAWPMALEGAPERILSGTSFAAPVAAAIAALVLEFCRQRPPLDELSERCVARIHTYEGMREVFRETMGSTDIGKFMLIQPWGLLDAWVEHDLEKQRIATASRLSAVIWNAFD